MKRTLIGLAMLTLPLAALANPLEVAHQPPSSSSGQASYSNPVIAGDYPDPSIIRVGDDYWAVATTSDWGPQFPLLHSRDLVNWTVGPAIFPKRPEWAVGKFWAPEIIAYKGRYYIYYTAEKKGGPLSVAVASADQVQGPYTDHGPIISQHDGSIDAVPANDVNGDRYLIWKEDSNSIGQPTPIFAQRLAEDGYTLIGQPKEILRNTEAWEGPLIEAPYVMRKGDYLYMFFSGNACCGNGCKYAVGVARAKSILGPWEKYSENPILAGNEKFRCPGHGSPVQDHLGQDWYFYHAVSQQDGIFVGRQAMLDRITWGADGWPAINNGQGPSAMAPLPYADSPQDKVELSHQETFSGALGSGWSWPQGNVPTVTVKGDGLWLAPGPDAVAGTPFAAALGRPTVSGDYVAETTVRPGATQAGLSAYGNRENAVGLMAGKGVLTLWEVTKGQVKELASEPFKGDQARLRLVTTGGNSYAFSVWRDGKWQQVGKTIDRSDLPPWDLGVRVALTSGGQGALFRDFKIRGEGR